eukprot:5325977-Pleurochrysis_carterae.AAC.1
MEITLRIAAEEQYASGTKSKSGCMRCTAFAERKCLITPHATEPPKNRGRNTKLILVLMRAI